MGISKKQKIIPYMRHFFDDSMHHHHYFHQKHCHSSQRSNGSCFDDYYNGDDYDSETTSFTYVINGSTLVSKCDLCGEITDHTFVISGNILYLEGKEYYRQ